MADSKRKVPPDPPPVPEPVEPPFYEATAPLPVGLPGTIPVFAAMPGDHVSPASVEANGWGGLVKVPDRFAGVLAPPPAASEAPPGAPTTGTEE